MYKSLLIVFCLLLNCGCGARIAEMSGKQRSERLATERGRISDLSDPVAKTKSYITISEILLTFATDAIREGATGDVKNLMEQYVTTVETARDTMVMSTRNPERKPAGFKDLEIAVRVQLRLLQDIQQQLAFDERKPVENAIAVATSIRDDMLRLLFPQSRTSA
jgi:hypothetical protein